MSYMDNELYQLNRHNNELETVLFHFVKCMSAQEMEALLNRQFPDNTAFTKENHIHSGSLSFKLNEAGEYVEFIGYDPET